jgi:hypothetical protein
MNPTINSDRGLETLLADARANMPVTEINLAEYRIFADGPLDGALRTARNLYADALIQIAEKLPSDRRKMLDSATYLRASVEVRAEMEKELVRRHAEQARDLTLAGRKILVDERARLLAKLDGPAKPAQKLTESQATLAELAKISRALEVNEQADAILVELAKRPAHLRGRWISEAVSQAHAEGNTLRVDGIVRAVRRAELDNIPGVSAGPVVALVADLRRPLLSDAEIQERQTIEVQSQVFGVLARRLEQRPRAMLKRYGLRLPASPLDAPKG